MSKNKNRPKRQQKKRKQEYKKIPRGKKFNPWIYKYFDMTADFTNTKRIPDTPINDFPKYHDSLVCFQKNEEE